MISPLRYFRRREGRELTGLANQSEPSGDHLEPSLWAKRPSDPVLLAEDDAATQLGQPKTAGNLIRYEAKYWVHPAQVPLIRTWVADYCDPDAHAQGDPPSYQNLTLQLDTPTLSFYHARHADAYSRFKLRVRAYDTDPDSQVVMEIKRKIGHNVIKSRARVRLGDFNSDMVKRFDRDLRFRDPIERAAYHEFSRLSVACGARPTVLVRYFREAWFSRSDDYARVTFDSRLSYQPTRSWTDWGVGGRWRSADIAALRGMPYGGVILELKSTNRVPLWMNEMVQHFDLVRAGICKYTLAVDQERLYLPDSEVN